jgi:hypothetical protein
MKNRCVRTKANCALIAVLLFGILANSISAADNSPEFLWAHQLGGNQGQASYGISVDPIGNIYVTGIAGNKTHQSIGTHLWHSSGGEVFLSKLSSTGKLLWQQNAGGSGIDAGLAVAADRTGGAYVAGYFSGKIKFGDVKLQAPEDRRTHLGSAADAFLVRYSSDGKLIWARQAGGTSLDQAYALATDKRGNAYITGYFQGKATFGSVKLESRTRPDGDHDPDTDYGDFFVAKYDSSGKMLWVRQAGDSGLNAGHGIAVDAAENVYVTGRFARSSGFGSFTNTISFGKISIADTNLCNFVAKYDRDGNILWAHPTAGVGELEFAHNYIAVDHANNVFLAGTFTFSQTIGDITLTELPGGNNELFLAKYDTDGKVLWCKQAGGKSHDTCEGLTVDESGNAYITGSFDENATFGTLQIQAKPHDHRVSGYESFIACYDPSGNVTRATTIDRNANMKGIACDNREEVYVMGNFRDSVTFGRTVLTSKKDFWGQQIGDVFIAKRPNH